MVAVKNLGDSGNMAGEVALGSLRDAATAPGDQDILGKAGVWVFDSGECELDAAFAKFLGKLGEITLCAEGPVSLTWWNGRGLLRLSRRRSGVASSSSHSPAVLSTFKTLSFAPVF
jgi:hypothetical protein